MTESEGDDNQALDLRILAPHPLALLPQTTVSTVVPAVPLQTPVLITKTARVMAIIDIVLEAVTVAVAT